MIQSTSKSAICIGDVSECSEQMLMCSVVAWQEKTTYGVMRTRDCSAGLRATLLNGAVVLTWVRSIGAALLVKGSHRKTKNFQVRRLTQGR